MVKKYRLVTTFAALLVSVPLSIAALPNAGGEEPSLSALRGDYNGDGRRNVVDVLLLLVRGSRDPGNPAYDYDGDGSFSASDALALLLDIVLPRQAHLDAVVVPTEVDSFFVNPGKGFVSVHSFNNWVSTFAHPLCSVAQFRWYWDTLEPEEDRIRFGLIDSMITQAVQNGQEFMMRVMCQNGEPRVPQWLRDKGLGGEYYSDGQGWQPDYDSPLFREEHGELIRELAARYDGHPAVDHVDIGTVGRWGEWHTSETGLDMPPDSAQRRVVDTYLENFTETPLIMLIGGGDALAHAVANGAGWRADCLGDWGMWGSSWNHMEDVYQQALDAAEANDAWKHAPVVFESCGTVQTWYDDGFDIDKTISESLRWHGSLVHLGTVEVPEPWREKVWDWGKKLGYRFVLERLSHESATAPGGSLVVRMEWENRGVAPCYVPHILAVRLNSMTTDNFCVMDTDADITGWLPGEYGLSWRLDIPDYIEPGEYRLGIAMLDPHTRRPAIKFPISGRGADGWYDLSHVTVE